MKRELDPVGRSQHDASGARCWMVPAYIATEALRGAREHGLDEGDLLKTVGISPHLLSAPSGKITVAQYGALWHEIALALDDEFIGMDSRRVKCGSTVMLCSLVVRSSTLAEALIAALQLLRLLLDDIEGRLVRDGEVATLSVIERSQDDTQSPPHPLAAGTYLMFLFQMASWLTGRRIPMLSTNFRCDDPRFVVAWRNIFTTDLKSGQSCTSLTFPSRYLDMLNIRTEEDLDETVRSMPPQFMLGHKPSGGYTARVRRLLRARPPSEWPEFGVVAESLGMSQATLHRRLTKEGQTYRTIAEDLRCDRAMQLLGETEASIADIADQLGFAEMSAFSRAFKKWAGVNPGEYRRMGALSQEYAGNRVPRFGRPIFPTAPRGLTDDKGLQGL